MVKIDQIHRSKTPRRPHFIPELAERRGLKQADLAKEIDADKSVVSRWWAGTAPGIEWQEKLAAFFFDDPTATERLFRHPDDDWFARFFRDRNRDEIERMKQTLETAFPKRNTNRN
jgi:transcriptional regulator with XRE-family HTH domain